MPKKAADLMTLHLQVFADDALNSEARAFLLSSDLFPSFYHPDHVEYFTKRERPACDPHPGH
jgi:hypothetical protein